MLKGPRADHDYEEARWCKGKGCFAKNAQSHNLVLVKYMEHVLSKQLIFNCRKGRIRAVFRWGPRIDVLSVFFRISLDSKIIFFSFTDIHLHYSLDIHLHFILFTFIFLYCYYHYYGYNNNNNYYFFKFCHCIVPFRDSITKFVL